MSKNINTEVKLREISTTLSNLTYTINNAFANIENVLKNVTIFLEKFNQSLLNISQHNNYEGLFNIVKVINDPNSIFNWLDYIEKFNNFYWVYPFMMNEKEVHYMVNNFTNEKQIDCYLLKYFTKNVTEKLFESIASYFKKTRNHKKVFKEIHKAYFNGLYSLVCLGLIGIIESELSYFLKNKGKTVGAGLLDPIVENLEEKSFDDDFILVVFANMLKNNVNCLYENINFNEEKRVKTNKQSRRHIMAHGRRCNLKKIDALMLLNTLYYTIYIKSSLRKYKSKVIYGSKRKFYLK